MPFALTQLHLATITAPQADFEVDQKGLLQFEILNHGIVTLVDRRQLMPEDLLHSEP
jgi:hypothetical protein